MRRREEVADGVVTLTLADPDGADLPEWTPGAHIDLVMTPSLVRQYSLCGSTSDRSEWRVGVLLDPDSRGGSQFVHDELHEGSTVRVRGPRNHFPLVSSPRYQFIAGGIGITPILTMIEAAEARGADWHLLYGGRERASMAFVDELERHGERVTVCAAGRAGRCSDLGSVLAAAAGGHAGVLLRARGAADGGRGGVRVAGPRAALHIERFSAKALEEPSPDALETFEVECQRSGVTVTVPADQTIYEVVEEAGVDVLGSCMEGVCGTCECEVIEGEPDHRDSVLSRGRAGQERHDHDLRFTLALGKAGARHMRPNYPFNCWYVAATSDEVGQELLGRRLLGVPVLLYRRGSGEVVAMEDRCVHRAYPLSARPARRRPRRLRLPRLRLRPRRPLRRRALAGERPARRAACARSRSTSRRRSSGSGSAIRERPRCARRRGHRGSQKGTGWASTGEMLRVEANYLLLHEHYLDLTERLRRCTRRRCRRGSSRCRRSTRSRSPSVGLLLPSAAVQRGWPTGRPR